SLMDAKALVSALAHSEPTDVEWLVDGVVQLNVSDHDTLVDLLAQTAAEGRDDLARRLLTIDVDLAPQVLGAEHLDIDLGGLDLTVYEFAVGVAGHPHASREQVAALLDLVCDPPNVFEWEDLRDLMVALASRDDLDPQDRTRLFERAAVVDCDTWALESTFPDEMAAAALACPSTQQTVLCDLLTVPALSSGTRGEILRRLCFDDAYP